MTGAIVMAVGGFIGFLAGNPLHAPVVGSVMGGAIGVSVLALIDTLRGYRLIHWLSGTLELSLIHI